MAAAPCADRGDVRVPCGYGAYCYRRSAAHTAEFSHPGDCDYPKRRKPTAAGIVGYGGDREE